MPKQTVDFNKLARLARFTDNEIIFNLFDSEIESIYESGKHRLERWGLIFGKSEVHLKGELEMTTKTIKVGGETPLGIVEDALLHTSITPNAWNSDWINIFDLMTRGEGQDKPMGLIRLSDHRQCWVNKAGANLFASTGAEMTRRQISRFWFSESLERLEQELRTNNSNNFEISYRAYKNETSSVVLDLVGENKVVQLDGEYYRLCSNKDSQIVEVAKLA
ncbi:hypothetical protein [Calothrix sp. CCY 0018]|uniref:hypothetical protein n=1 Tax=Calothrix sp. CCY 0018 TaxID=3103864 RepID=UPI0039C6DB95